MKFSIIFVGKSENFASSRNENFYSQQETRKMLHTFSENSMFYNFLDLDRITK